MDDDDGDDYADDDYDDDNDDDRDKSGYEGSFIRSKAVLSTEDSFGADESQNEIDTTEDSNGFTNAFEVRYPKTPLLLPNPNIILT